MSVEARPSRPIIDNCFAGRDTLTAPTRHQAPLSQERLRHPPKDFSEVFKCQSLSRSQDPNALAR